MPSPRPSAGRAISAVNLQEVAKEMLREGVSPEAARAVIDEPGLDARAHDREAAHAAAMLHPHAERHGRGLGDRTCMALGIAMGAPALTTDRDWRHVEARGMQIEDVR